MRLSSVLCKCLLRGLADWPHVRGQGVVPRSAKPFFSLVAACLALRRPVLTRILPSSPQLRSHPPLLLSIRYMSGDTLRSRSQHRTPSHEDAGENLPRDLNHRGYLRHPGYSDTGNILMVLPALDHPQGGIHHETARIARAIVANNRWEGFLTETRTGERA